MPELIVKYPDRAPDRFPLGRLRITLGRSARNDLCIPDPFASRVHAEVRREGEEYYLQDLGSANGTLYNGGAVEGTCDGVDCARAVALKTSASARERRTMRCITPSIRLTQSRRWGNAARV